MSEVQNSEERREKKMSQTGKTLEELSPDERQGNREAVGELREGQVCSFIPPASTVPLERRARGVPNAGVPITFSRAKYLGWREEQEEHMFFAETLKGKFFAPVFLCGGVACIPLEGEQEV